MAVLPCGWVAGPAAETSGLRRYKTPSPDCATVILCFIVGYFFNSAHEMKMKGVSLFCVLFLSAFHGYARALSGAPVSLEFAILAVEMGE
ncbi:MAG: hypothetical protein HUU21_14975 [Polyangiaceae bacterium]|nr:hypothetical protein [Polyangiaceae bacterium]